MNAASFVATLSDQNIQLSNKQVEQFTKYYQLLVKWNNKMNLTAITNREDVYLKHFFDSLTAAFHFHFQDQTLCDVGAGAGFPSIPLKICFPKLKVTVVDSLNKRIQFLNELVTQLGLLQVRLVHDRAETFGRINSNRECFDIVTARAVARMSTLSELCLPLVKKDGFFLSLKAASTAEELNAATGAIYTLGGKLVNNVCFRLPEENSQRHIVIIQKMRRTPNKYPRRPGVPNREPLE